MGLPKFLLLSVALLRLGMQESVAADEFTADRNRMVEQQIADRGVKDESVLAAMRKVPRHRFVPNSEQRYAYRDTPLPIGENQTISQPYIVALMTELLRPKASHRVLEVGTGSGYQAAVLAQLVERVYTIELEPTLARTAQAVFDQLGYKNIVARAGDGYAGWTEHAPFDAIIVTAAPDHIPQPLIDQLKPGGTMVVPVGPVSGTQQLRVLRKKADGTVSTTDVSPVRFVPLRRQADE